MTKTNKFQVGDRVAVYEYQPLGEYDDARGFISPRYDEYGEQICFGEVMGLPSKGEKRYTIDWDDRGEYCDPPEEIMVEESLLVLEKDVPKLQKTLEKEFKATSKLVEAKMNKASKLIQEANKMANAINFQLVEMDLGNLYSVMDEAGWHTSSFEC